MRQSCTVPVSSCNSSKASARADSGSFSALPAKMPSSCRIDASTAAGYSTQNASSRGVLQISAAAARNSESPLPERALNPTTGRESRKESSSKSISKPWRLASSIKLTQTSTFGVRSAICKTKCKLRARQVASQTTATASLFPAVMYSPANSSSLECANREYVPGKSTSVYCRFSKR